MNLRTIVLLTGLAIFLAGCVVNPRPYPPSDYDQRYADDYYDYRDTPSYEGYYYARIIFISNVPYYVDDDRHVRPIPPRLHEHFRRYQYNTLGRPPVFSRDAEVRDGYRVSHIIYLDGVPYNVENDRIARPLPEQLHQHFRDAPSRHDNAPENGNRPQPPGQHDNDRHDNGRNDVPPLHDSGQDHRRDEPWPNGQDPNRDHMQQQPSFDRGQREGERNAPADTQGRPTPFTDQRTSPLRQGQPSAGEPQATTANGMERDRHGNRQQPAGDAGKKNADVKKADKNKSRPVKKDKKDDSTKADDDSGNKHDNGMKSRRNNDQ